MAGPGSLPARGRSDAARWRSVSAHGPGAPSCTSPAAVAGSGPGQGVTARAARVRRGVRRRGWPTATPRPGQARDVGAERRPAVRRACQSGPGRGSGHAGQPPVPAVMGPGHGGLGDGPAAAAGDARRTARRKAAATPAPMAARRAAAGCSCCPSRRPAGPAPAGRRRAAARSRRPGAPAWGRGRGQVEHGHDHDRQRHADSGVSASRTRRRHQRDRAGAQPGQAPRRTTTHASCTWASAATARPLILAWKPRPT